MSSAPCIAAAASSAAPGDPPSPAAERSSPSAARGAPLELRPPEGLRLMASFEVALQEVQKQQRESLARMDVLKQQHRDWQAAVEELLRTVEHVSRFNGDLTAARAPAGAEPSSDPRSRSASDGSVAMLSEESTEEETAGSRQSTRSRLKSLRQSMVGGMPKILEDVWVDFAPSESKAKLTWWEQRRRYMAKVVDSITFEYATGLLILVNIILIGVEAEMSAQHRDTSWATELERGFLTIYTAELLLRFVVGGMPMCRNAWFLLDFFLVCIGLVALVVVPLVESSASLQEGWQNLLLARGLRLLRLARVFRTLKRFKVVWRLVSGLLSVWDTMASTTCLILLWLYIFGCIAMEVIASDDELKANERTSGVVLDHFSSLPRATLTLLQFVTLDAIANVYFPLVTVKPVLIIYFLPLLMFLSIALMNLVTAVLVEHALEHASQEAELAKLRKKQQIKATLPQLLEIFGGLDADGSGFLTKEEVAGVPLDVLPPNVLEHVSVDNMEDLFEMLDMDGGGSLTQAEFLDGLLSLLLLDIPIWAIQLQKLLMPMRKNTLQISKDMSSMVQMAHEMPNIIQMSKDMQFIKEFHLGWSDRP